jgi:hypothetical protein
MDHKGKTMIKEEKGEPRHTAEENLDAKGKTINIMKTTHIYCGRPTVGYEVIRGRFDVGFTTDLGEVHRLIDEYYGGGRTGSNRQEKN